eukprot:4732032-Pyramimonas_sp.AAC.1
MRATTLQARAKAKGSTPQVKFRALVHSMLKPALHAEGPQVPDLHGPAGADQAQQSESANPSQGGGVEAET